MKTLTQLSKVAPILTLALSLLFQAQAHSAVRVGLVLDRGGKDDNSFNAAAFKGAELAKKDFGTDLKYVEATDDNAFEAMLRSLAQKKFDIVIAVGISQVDAVKKVAAQFPQQKFALVDGIVDLPNVRSLVFAEHEGSFLVGAIAAQVSKTGKVGFIGGMDIPLIRRFKMGYEAGAKAINPKATVLTNYVGMTADAWNNPAKAKELAVHQFDAGADVVFSAAGASGNGVFDAAEEMKKLAIGVDSNQNGVKPGYVLTSMVKKVDQAVYMACKDTVKGTYTAGTVVYGLDNQGVEYSVDRFNEKLLSVEVRKKVDELKAKIIAGKIRVPDYYKKK